MIAGGVISGVDKIGRGHLWERMSVDDCWWCDIRSGQDW